MSKIRMNTELRNKILNRYRESAESENTQELEAMKQAREGVDRVYPEAFNLATQVVERSYPSEDVATCRTLKQKYGEPLDVVAKDKCFLYLDKSIVKYYIGYIKLVRPKVYYYLV